MKFLTLFALSIAIFGLSSAQGPSGGYTPIEYSDNLENVLDFGVSEALNQAIDAKELLNTDWQWTNVIDAWIQDVDNGVNYQFFVEMKDVFGHVVKLDVVVFIDATAETNISLSHWKLYPGN